VNAQSSPGSPSSPKSQSSPRSRIGPNWQNGEDRRTRILRAAAELFTAKGYAGVSMDEVQSKVGGSKSTLYRHFADKTDLFRAAVEMMIDERNHRVLDFKPQGGDATTTLTEFGRHFAAVALNPDAIALLRLVVSEAERVPGLGQTFYDHGPTRDVAALAAHLRALHEANAITASAPLLAAAQLYQAMLGPLQTRLLVNAGPKPTPDEIEASITAAVTTFLGTSQAHS
jgi:TetR/AcrR family transcriptional regulator, mexJK operon transcriptional repressor